MMQDLSDPERPFEFAEAAGEVDDVRGAIAALERILPLNPNLPNIALELGVDIERPATVGKRPSRVCGPRRDG
jgi:hypothetical protein